MQTATRIGNNNYEKYYKYAIYVPAREGSKSSFESVQIDPECILFKDKTYPNCWTCDRKYIEQLGCLWCSGKIDTWQT